MFRCTNCSHTSPKWVGKCPSCGTWNSLVEEAALPKKSQKVSRGGASVTVSWIEAKGTVKERTVFSSSELTRALGGGLVSSSFTLLAGEPWVGKSTLSLQLADWSAMREKTVLYVSGEETTDQLSERATRLGVKNPSVRLAHSTTLEDILATVAADSSHLVIIDSVSVISAGMSDSSAGSASQVRIVAEAFLEVAKKSGKSVILIGHVTKDGAISGPKALEHLVDTILFLEGSSSEDYRILRVLKNRFGPTDEIALFRMEETGLTDIANPGIEFISSDRSSLIGSALSVTMEGNRPLIIEVEALTVSTKFGYPKRSSRGIPQSKVDLIIAMLQKYLSVPLDSSDIYVNVARGLSVSESAIDLAIAAAILSSKSSKPLWDTIFVGELSLTGRAKSVTRAKKRLDESARLGFTSAVVGGKVEPGKRTQKVTTIEHLSDLKKIIPSSKNHEE